MKKTKLASIFSLCMVPTLFMSSESSAIPAWSRKYAISCNYCHSGFPTRNAMGEAFMNNGFRLPGGKEEIFTKQAQVKLGNESWASKFPNSIMPSDIPGYDALSVYVSGGVINYKQGTTLTPEILNWSGPANARILYGATIGENFSIFGGIEGISHGTPESNVRAVWAFSPGINVSFGNMFSSITGQKSAVSVADVLPAPGTGMEFTFTRGEEGGFSIIAGLSSNTATPEQTSTAANPKMNDIRYIRAKYKLYGSGLLSGTGGVTSNSFNGIDNQISIGCGLVSARDNATDMTGTTYSVLDGNFAGETLVYGIDLQATHSGIMGGLAYSKDKDLDVQNFAADAGYYVYPWLLAKVRYMNIASAGDRKNPTIATSIAGYLRPNISLTATYTAYTQSYNADIVDPANENANTFTLTAAAAF